MRSFWALLRARNIEFYRDRGSMAWAFIFPVLVILGCALAFSRPPAGVFTVGVVGDAVPEALHQAAYLDVRLYDDIAAGEQRIAHHQLDLLLDLPGSSYLINPQSVKGAAVQELLEPQLEGAGLARREMTGRAIRYVDWVIPGVLGMNIMFGALFGVGYVIVRYRQNGVLKRLQATPVTPLQFIGAQLGSRLLIVVAVNAVIFIGFSLLLDLLMLGSWINLLLIAIAGGLSMVALGLLISSRTANEELGGGLLNLVSWPMLFLSDVWFSLDRAPEWLRGTADALPLTHIVKAARAVMIEGAGFGDIASHLIALLLMTAVFTGLAAVLFRWHKAQ